MRAIAPQVHPDVPVRVYAEGQEEYRPISVAVFRDGPDEPYPGAYRLVTAYKPTRDEIGQLVLVFNDVVQGRVPLPLLEELVVALFERCPIVVELLSANPVLVPQNVYVGVPDWMRAPRPPLE